MHTRAYTHTQTCTHNLAHMATNKLIHTHRHTYTRTQTHTHVHTHTHTCTHAHTQTQTHTVTHSHTHARARVFQVKYEVAGPKCTDSSSMALLGEDKVLIVTDDKGVSLTLTQPKP